MGTPTDTMTAETNCVPDEASLPDGPYTSLRYHFGMLLGVDDFSTEQRYHRGKMRLHNAWLHRAGVVWGLEVTKDLPLSELRVARGLALDPSGRELHLDGEYCVDVGKWYDKHEAQVTTRTPAGGGVEFDAHVELRFCSCATRQVPAIADPCAGAETDTAYSRTFETVEINLVPGLADPPPAPYPRLRLLFGLDADVPPEVTLDDRDEVLAARGDAANFLNNFREFANRDALNLQPALTPDGEHSVPFPFRDDEPLVLANVRNITLKGESKAWKLVDAEIDLAPRRSHVATATIQELLCRGGAPAGGGGGASAPGADAGGPRVDSVTLDRTTKTIVLRVNKPFAKPSVDAEPFRVSYFGSSGWRPVKITSAKPSGDGLEATIKLRAEPGTDLVRLVARGTGQTPLLGADNVPFAGGADAPPGTADEGHDYTHMFSS